jgi:chromate reductase
MQGGNMATQTGKKANTVSIFGFAGSLRRGSYNKAILRAAQDLVPDGAQLETFDLEGIPPFNQDLEDQPPARVKESIPGVLKNAIDWASRPYGDNAFDGKPVAIMGASIGMLGSARAQYHLRQTFVWLNMHPLNQPEVMVPFAQKMIDEQGRVTDQKTKDKIRELLEGLVSWTKRLRLNQETR